MSDTAIKVENLGKRYRIGQIVGYSTLRESLMNLAYAPMRRLRQTGDRRQKTGQKTEDGRQKTGQKMDDGRRETEESGLRSPVLSHSSSVSSPPSSVSGHPNTIWALKDVSFEVKRGEAVGIIGRNGSGKTTILKILSRITAPTEGCVEIHGRVGSLLEVGTGFHPELTGRENIYLNGAVIGMKKAEVERKFDEIVAFSEIEKFLDTPVKRYSSGMYVRLAFAVAAHLEPEILIVDEVLAVGDSEFQKKCLGKMSNVSKEGRTVLFVSHNMGAVNRLCSRSMWLDKGQLKMSGPSEGVIAAYLSMGSGSRGEIMWDDEQQAPGNDCFRLRAVRIRNSSGEVSSTLDTELPFSVEVDYAVKASLSGARIGISLVTSDGTLIFTSCDTDGALDLLHTREPGMHRSRCRIPGGLLNSGQYSVTVAADIPMQEVLFLCENVLPFHMEMVKGPGSKIQDGRRGIIRPMLDWEVN